MCHVLPPTVQTYSVNQPLCVVGFAASSQQSSQDRSRQNAAGSHTFDKEQKILWWSEGEMGLAQILIQIICFYFFIVFMQNNCFKNTWGRGEGGGQKFTQCLNCYVLLESNLIILNLLHVSIFSLKTGTQISLQTHFRSLKSLGFGGYLFHDSFPIHTEFTSHLWNTEEETDSKEKHPSACHYSWRHRQNLLTLKSTSSRFEWSAGGNSAKLVSMSECPL